ncbi:MAG: site-specific integrase [Prevotella sp.]|nr:site-specific integrase [Prevotella sp.]MBR1558510.1 site-specific integrase [Prevotella sp.]
MMKPKKEALDIATLYNRWLNECERIKSPCTVRAFTITINNYIDFLTDVQGFKTKSFSLGKCFSRAMIEKWLCWLEKKKKCSPQSCNVRLSNLRSFLRVFTGMT